MIITGQKRKRKKSFMIALYILTKSIVYKLTVLAYSGWYYEAILVGAVYDEHILMIQE
jgi:hypothetical protein